jgi:acetyl-CoA C-acetyltransferase
MGKLARGVALIGAGMSKFGAFPDKTGRELFVEAYTEAMNSVDNGIDNKDIEEMFLGNFSSDIFEGQIHNGPIMADWVGLIPKPVTRTEGACASSGIAIRCGIMAIASGLCDVVCVSGVEKMTNLPTARVTDTLGAASDVSYEFPVGATFPGLYATIATAHMKRYGTTIKQLRTIGVKNHKNGALNPKAQFSVSIKDLMEKRIKKLKDKGEDVPDWKDEFDFLEDLRANPVIAWPLRLFDCSPITDGAAVLFLAAEEVAKKYTDTPIHIIGSGQGSVEPALHDRADITTIFAAREAAKEAYKMAGVKPEDIQVAEVHDCFTIAEIVATEDLEFFKPGEGGKAAEEGVTARDGAKPTNTSGGLKSKGHPVGASGAGQVIEIWKQLRGTAGPRQVPDVELALAHNVGGTGGSCAVHIFRR